MVNNEMEFKKSSSSIEQKINGIKTTVYSNRYIQFKKY